MNEVVFGAVVDIATLKIVAQQVWSDPTVASCAQFFQFGLTVVESGRVTELCVAASCEPAMQVRTSDISSVQTSILC